MRLVLYPETVLRILLLCVSLILAAHLVGMVLWHGFGYDRVYGTIGIFRLDGERNIPTLFSTLQLSLAAAILFFVGAVQTTYKWHWFLLAAAFLFLTADEFIGFHEMLAVSLGKSDPTRTLQFAWLMPYLLGVVLFAISFVPFLLKLPRRTAVLFLISGSVFVGAALGIEALTGLAEEAGYSVDDIRQRSLATVEEVLEMGSISLFIYALLDFLRNRNFDITLLRR